MIGKDNTEPTVEPNKDTDNKDTDDEDDEEEEYTPPSSFREDEMIWKIWSEIQKYVQHEKLNFGRVTIEDIEQLFSTIKQ